MDAILGQLQAVEQARDRFGRSVYYSLLTNIHKTAAGATDGTYFHGGRNIAKMLSEGRVLFWKDGKAWADHMKDFGSSVSPAHRLASVPGGSCRELDRAALAC